jgi:hypothetical protein
MAMPAVAASEICKNNLLRRGATLMRYSLGVDRRNGGEPVGVSSAQAVARSVVASRLWSITSFSRMTIE